MSNYKDKYQVFYNSKEWKYLRRVKFRAAAGLCEECLKKGKIVAGREVHHKEPIEKNWEKRLDYDNLILLCDECHRLAHERSSRLQEFNKFWEEINAAKTKSCT